MIELGYPPHPNPLPQRGEGAKGYSPLPHGGEGARRHPPLWRVNLVLVLAFASVGGAATLPVDIGDPSCDNVVGAPYCQIGPATAAAMDGDTIEIAPGTYSGNLFISKDLLLRGADPATTIVSGGASVVMELSGSVVVEGLTLSDSPGRGVVSSGDSVRIFRSIIENNGPAAGGGGVLQTGGSLILEDTIVRGNTSNAPNIAGGAGLWIQAGSNLFVTESQIVDNHNLHSGSPGGGIKIDQANATFATCLIADNTSLNNGGGVTASGPGTLVVDSCTVSGNQAALGGGGFQLALPTTIRNSTISGNWADGNGAIIRFFGFDPIVLENVTVYGNEALSASATGGVSLGAESQVSNSILAGNFNATGPDDCRGTLGSVGYNLVQAVACTITGDLTGNLVGVDPKLYPLADRGGRFPVHGFAIDSPVLDAGSPNLAGAGSCPVLDQRAMGRPVDGDGDGTSRCDIGSVERRAPLFYDGLESGDTSGWSAVVGEI